MTWERTNHSLRSRITIKDHPNAGKQGLIRIYRFRAAEALGKPIPASCIIHHYGKKELVICESINYHFLLHVRQRAYAATGDPHKRWCCICQKWDDPDKMLHRAGESYRHATCHTQAERNRRERTKANFIGEDNDELQF